MQLKKIDEGFELIQESLIPRDAIKVKILGNDCIVSRDADYKVKRDIILWKDGIWYDGIWKDGIWKDGIWKDGVWHGGTWVDGTWVDGIWNA